MSLCRVYVVSGKFGAFDRRPTATETSSSRREIIMKITQENDDKLVGVSENENATTTATTTLMEEIGSSSGSSFSELENQTEWAHVEN